MALDQPQAKDNPNANKPTHQTNQRNPPNHQTTKRNNKETNHKSHKSSPCDSAALPRRCGTSRPSSRLQRKQQLEQKSCSAEGGDGVGGGKSAFEGCFLEMKDGPILILVILRIMLIF